MSWGRLGSVALLRVAGGNPAAPRHGGESMSVGLAVIGAGYWGPNLIRNFAGIEACDLKVVCDRDPARLEALRRPASAASRRQGPGTLYVPVVL